MYHVPKQYAWSDDLSRYFVDKIASLHKMPKSENGDNSAKSLQNFAKN